MASVREKRGVGCFLGVRYNRRSGDARQFVIMRIAFSGEADEWSLLRSLFTQRCGVQAAAAACSAPIWYNQYGTGRVAEWSMATVLKTVRSARVS